MALLAVASPSAAQHLLVRQVNLAELSQRAGVIVHGRVVDVRREPHPNYPNVPTLVVTLDVLANLRGAPGPRFSFRQYVEEIEVSGAPAASAPGKYLRSPYTVGQELLLFLYPNSRYGFTSPVGAGQGHFRVVRDAAGRRAVLNEVSNRGLFTDVAAAAQRAGLALSPAEHRLLQQAAGPVEMESFVGLVQRLAVLRGEP